MRELDHITEAQWAYLAGIIDGEGCFSMTKHASPTGYRKIRYRVRVFVTSTSTELIQWLETTFAGGILTDMCRGTEKHSASQNIIWQGKAFDIIVPQLIPYLVVKRAQADLFLRYRKLQAFCWKERRANREQMRSILQLREWFYHEAHRLNAKGPKTATTNTPDMGSFARAALKIESELYGDVQRLLGDERPASVQ